VRFELRDIGFSYSPASDFSLRDISATFGSHEVIGLAGANGSGKTTVIRILLRQLVSYRGSYRIDGAEVEDIRADMLFRHRLGYAPDIPVLDECLTGYELLGLVGEMRGVSAEGFDEELRRFDATLHLGEWLKQRPCSQYSAGMRKKVSIALAYLGDRSLVILDEPVNGLDPMAVWGLRELIQDKAKEGVGTVVSSHILDFLEKSAAKVLLMRSGEALFYGPLHELLARREESSLEHVYYAMYRENRRE
jgi:ABC-type multidrug transport system ATPase subunit